MEYNNEKGRNKGLLTGDPMEQRNLGNKAKTTEQETLNDNEENYVSLGNNAKARSKTPPTIESSPNTSARHSPVDESMSTVGKGTKETLLPPEKKQTMWARFWGSDTSEEPEAANDNAYKPPKYTPPGGK